MQKQVNWPLLAGVRFVLALVVAAFHISGVLVDGNIPFFNAIGPGGAVTAFFIISGWSMSHSYNGDVASFYRRRFWRIWPMYAVGVLLSYLPNLIWSQRLLIMLDDQYALPSISKVFAQLAGLAPGLVSHPRANLTLWSVGIEMAFYVLVPALALIRPRWLLPVFAASVAYYSVAPQEHLIFQGWSLYLRSFWAFYLGFVAFRLQDRWQISLLPFVAGLVTCIQSVRFHETIGSVLLVVLAGCSLVYGYKLEVPTYLARILNYLGDLSYPLYVMHWPLALVASLLYLNISIGQTAIILPAILAVSALALHTIDRPLRKLGRHSKKSAAPQFDVAPIIAA